jgi:hypothetical protein
MSQINLSRLTSNYKTTLPINGTYGGGSGVTGSGTSPSYAAQNGANGGNGLCLLKFSFLS